MRRRSSIPAQYWTILVACAVGRSIDGVSLQELADAVAITIAAIQPPPLQSETAQ